MLMKFIFLAIATSSLNLFAFELSNSTVIACPEEDEIFFPHFSTNEKGDIAVGWYAERNDKEAVQVTYRENGGAWSTPYTVSSWEDDIVISQLNINSEGRVSICWKVIDNKNHYIKYAYKQRSSSWSLPLDLVFQNQPFVAEYSDISPTGSLLTVNTYADKNYNDSIKKVLVNSLDTNFQVNSYQLENQSISTHLLWALETNSAFLLWQKIDNTSYSKILESVWLQNGYFGSVQKIFLPIYPSEISFEAACVNQDQAILCINAQNKQGFKISSEIPQSRYYLLNLTNQDNSEPFEINCDYTSVGAFQVGINKKGDAVAVWEQGSDKYTLGLVYKAAGQDWIYIRDLENIEGENRNPNIAIDEEGNFVLVWTKEKGTKRAAIYAAVFFKESLTLSEPKEICPYKRDIFDPFVALTNDHKGVIGWTFDENHIELLDFTY